MEDFEKIFKEYCKNAYEGVVYFKKGEVGYNAQYGIDLDKKIACSGVTKLFTVACILRLFENKKLILDSKITNYLDEEQVKGLCVIKGTDYSSNITVRDLLYQTSGFNDYFDARVKQTIQKSDMGYTFDDKLIWTKSLNGIAKPGKTAYYANLNIDLLAYILEKVVGKPLKEIYKEYIIGPLALKSTYLIESENTKAYIPALYLDGRAQKRPFLLMSSYGSGGLVSTPRDLMKFIRGFFSGWIFEEDLIEKLKGFGTIENGYGNILYGGGLMKLKSKRTILGQIGYSGAFVFADSENKIYCSGYISQASDKQLLPKMIAEMFDKI